MVNLTNMHMWVITMLCIWMRSKGVMVQAQQFGELLKRVRYGKFDQYAYVGNYNACIWMPICSGSTTIWRIIKTW